MFAILFSLMALFTFSSMFSSSDSVNYKREEKEGMTNIQAFINNEKVGFVYYACSDCELLSIMIDPRYRKQGQGKKLVEMALQDMQKKGCKKADVEAAWPIKNFFYKLGFKNQMPWWIRWYPIDLVPMRYIFKEKKAA